MRALWDLASAAGPASARFIGRAAEYAAADLLRSRPADPGEALRGRSVLLTTKQQLHTVFALMALDGVAQRMVLCTPDLSEQQLRWAAAAAAADAIVADEDATLETLGLPVHPIGTLPIPRHPSSVTEWVLLTSGTTSQPKLVAHSLQTLSALLSHGPAAAPTVWSTFYDVRRYGGLQIFLRAVLAGAPLVLSDPAEALSDFLERCALHGVTHMSGTPSHWRQVLMSGKSRFDPSYIRLSGEIADQPVLDALREKYPRARIAHAFASTEAGVGFEVEDGRAGFPAAFIQRTLAGVELKVEQGTLHIRSARTAHRYLGAAAEPLAGPGGFVDTQDLVELVHDRYYFRGRRGGVINVGGHKVYPEEVEGILNADPRVRVSRVRARRNPITGAVVVADVVLARRSCTVNRNGAETEDRDRAHTKPSGNSQPEPNECARTEANLKRDLLLACRQALPAYKVPAVLSIVDSLELTAGGKLVRPNA